MAIELAPGRARIRERVTRVVRQWSPPSWFPIPGPYTSIMVPESSVSSSLVSVPVSARTALAVAAVYRALATYSDLIGTLPVQRLRGDERLPSPPFVERPAGEVVGWTDEIGQALWSLLLRGNAYLRVTSTDSTGYPATFHVLNPDIVIVERAPSGAVRYRWDTGDGTEQVIDGPAADELLHVRLNRPPGHYCGLGVLDVQQGPASTLRGAYASEAYANELMGSPMPPAVLTHPLRLNATQAAALQEQWATSIGRARAVPAVLSGGISYPPLTVTAKDVELIESRRWNATQIAVLFGLPAWILGGSTGDSMTYSTVELELTRLWTMALMPQCVRLERHLNAWVPNGQRLRFVPDALLRAQTLERYQAHAIAISGGWETVDEVRALENRPPLESLPPVPVSVPEPMPLPASPGSDPAMEVVP
jgi:HK97 family phage portal protein